MLGRWLRVGDYYNVENLEDGSRHVAFIPDSVTAVITRIDIRYRCYEHNESSTQISFTFSPVYSQELMTACEHLSIRYQERDETFTQFAENNQTIDSTNEDYILLHAKIYTVDMTLDETNKNKIIKLFNYFNQKMDTQPFAKELLIEIEQIQKASQLKSFSSNQHLISAYSPKKNNINKRKEYEWLADVLAYELPTNKYKQYLVQGDDPNESQQYGSYTPLTYAMLRQSSHYPLELLLWYEANPFVRPIEKGSQGTFSFSAYELAVAYGQSQKANLVVNEFSRVSKRQPTISKPGERLFITQSNVNYIEQNVSSSFSFSNNKTIHTVLKSAAEMSESERKAVYDLFECNFEALNDHHNETLKKIFNKDFSGNKLIDIIFDEKKVIGFNLIEMINLNKTNCFVNCAYAAILPEYRGYGLMVFLSFRFAYVLQQVVPDKKVGVFYSAVHYNSYRMAGFKHFPKYQNGVTEEMMLDLIGEIYHSNEVPYTHYCLMQYIIEELRVRSTKQVERERLLNERIYTREILGLDDVDRLKDHTRAAPVVFFIDEDNFQYINKAASDLGVDFALHVKSYAKNLGIFMSQKGFLFGAKLTDVSSLFVKATNDNQLTIHQYFSKQSKL